MLPIAALHSRKETATGAGSVHRLGLHFGSLRPTSQIHGCICNRKIYRYIRTWFQQTCTSGLEMIIRTLWLIHITYKCIPCSLTGELATLSVVPLVVPIVSSSPKYRPQRFESTSKIVGLSDPKSRWTMGRTHQRTPKDRWSGEVQALHII